MCWHRSTPLSLRSTATPTGGGPRGHRARLASSGNTTARGSVALTGAYQPGLVGECDEFGAGVAVEFLQNVADADLCDEGADDEPAGDLGVAEAAGDEQQDVVFAVGEFG